MKRLKKIFVSILLLTTSTQLICSDKPGLLKRFTDYISSRRSAPLANNEEGQSLQKESDQKESELRDKVYNDPDKQGVIANFLKEKAFEIGNGQQLTSKNFYTSVARYGYSEPTWFLSELKKTANLLEIPSLIALANEIPNKIEHSYANLPAILSNAVKNATDLTDEIEKLRNPNI